jgi:long-chain acyl-CoA synthetase
MHDLSQNDCILFIVSFDAALPAMIAYLHMGASIVLEEAQNIESITATSRNYGVTHVSATPLFYQMLLTHADADERTFPAIRYYISTGAPLADRLSESFRARFGREITQYYGIGECGPVFFNVSNDIRKRGSAGVLVSGCEAKLIGEHESPESDFGDLWVRGPGLFGGYYDPWRPGEEILIDGWFSTGDLARRDSDGFYWVVGRTKDIINIAGTKVFPREIEEIILGHEAVEGTLVFAASDARFGEVPHAKVKLRTAQGCTERELLRYVNDRLSILKALRKVEFVDDIPRTENGKVIRWGHANT